MIRVKSVAIQKEQVEPFFDRWHDLSGRIHEAHDQRNGQARESMEQGIVLFEQCVVHSSETDTPELLLTENYEVLPLNGMERLQFIQARPAQYACYRQLDELFKELRKRLARLRVTK